MQGSPSPKPGAVHELLGVELLRFTCAISVLLWHYQHFYFQGSTPVGFETSAQPLYAIFKPFYEVGRLGVQAFWTLSGFIFFWKYAQPVAQGLVSARRFTVLRLSRLYPLHFLTLMVAVGLGFWYRSLHGGVDFVYTHNDWLHFGLQLFMASDWLGLNQSSFNGPIWSISIEVLVYALFFVLSAAGLVRWWHALALMGVAGAVYALKLTDHPLVQCVFFFYLGGLTHLFHAALSQRPRAQQLAAQALGVLAVAAAAVPLCNGALKPVFFVALLTPVALLLMLDWVQPQSPQAAVWISRLGNTTYASYLLHYPLQLLAVCLSSALGLALPLHEPAWLLAYIVAVFALAMLVYEHVEMPAQRWMRRMLDKA